MASIDYAFPLVEVRLDSDEPVAGPVVVLLADGEGLIRLGDTVVSSPIGDMFLAAVQVVTGQKTFAAAKLVVAGAGAGTASFTYETSGASSAFMLPASGSGSTILTAASGGTSTTATHVACATGTAGVLQVRALTSSDVPTIPFTKGGTGLTALGAANTLLAVDTGGTAIQFKSLSSSGGISISNVGSVITIAGTGATVSSVALSLPAELSVSGSPITTSGTFTVTWANATANQVFAGPSTGSPGTPAFRALVSADLPTVPTTKGGTNLTTLGAANTFLGVNSGGTAYEAKALSSSGGITLGHGAGTLSIAGNGATVSSVALSLPAELTVSGSPVTTTGTLSATWASQTKNRVFASPDGSSGTPSFRAIVPADLPSQWSTVFKTSDQTVNNSTTLVDDNELQVPLAANGRYILRGYIQFTTAAAADFKWRHTGPASPTRVQLARFHINPSGNDFVTKTVDQAYSAADLTIVSTIGTSDGCIWFWAIIENGSTAGNFKIQWAQNTGDVSDTKVLAGSHIDYFRAF